MVGMAMGTTRFLGSLFPTLEGDKLLTVTNLQLINKARSGRFSYSQLLDLLLLRVAVLTHLEIHPRPRWSESYNVVIVAPRVTVFRWRVLPFCLVLFRRCYWVSVGRFSDPSSQLAWCFLPYLGLKLPSQHRL